MASPVDLIHANLGDHGELVALLKPRPIQRQEKTNNYPYLGFNRITLEIKSFVACFWNLEPHEVCKKVTQQFKVRINQTSVFRIWSEYV